MMDGRKAIQLGNIDDDVKAFFATVGVFYLLDEIERLWLVVIWKKIFFNAENQ